MSSLSLETCVDPENIQLNEAYVNTRTIHSTTCIMHQGESTSSRAVQRLWPPNLEIGLVPLLPYWSKNVALCDLWMLHLAEHGAQNQKCSMEIRRVQTTVICIHIYARQLNSTGQSDKMTFGRFNKDYNRHTLRARR